MKQALACFENGEGLDSLIFLINKLHCLLLAVDFTNDELLEMVTVGLCLLQELDD